MNKVVNGRREWWRSGGRVWGGVHRIREGRWGIGGRGKDMGKKNRAGGVGSSGEKVDGSEVCGIVLGSIISCTGPVGVLAIVVEVNVIGPVANLRVDPGEPWLSKNEVVLGERIHNCINRVVICVASKVDSGRVVCQRGAAIREDNRDGSAFNTRNEVGAAELCADDVTFCTTIDENTSGPAIDCSSKREEAVGVLEERSEGMEAKAVAGAFTC